MCSPETEGWCSMIEDAELELFREFYANDALIENAVAEIEEYGRKIDDLIDTVRTLSNRNKEILSQLKNS